MFKNMCSGSCDSMNCSAKDLGLLLLRIGVGITFIIFGWMKVSDMGMTVAFFAQLGIPTFLTYIVAWGELLGGLAILLGILIPVSAIFLSVVMVVAIATVTGKAGFPAYVPNALLILNSIALIFLGAGRFSIFKCGMSQGMCWCGKKDGMSAPMSEVK